MKKFVSKIAIKFVLLWGYMETVRRYAEKVTQNFDVILGITGVSVGIFIVSLYYLINLNQKDIGIAILLSCLIYIFFRQNFKS